MDEMKIKLNTRLMKGIVSKLISKIIFKQVGFKPEIHLNEIEIEMKDGKMQFHIDVNGSVDEKAFLKITQLIDKEES